jgi:hypothetical protein
MTISELKSFNYLVKITPLHVYKTAISVQRLK